MLVVPTVICSSVVAERIAAASRRLGVALPHLAGCGQLGPDMRVTHETLAAYCATSERRRACSSSRSAASRSSRSISPTRRGRPASRRDRRDSVRRRNRPRDREGERDRARTWRRELAPRPREWCDDSLLVLSLKCGGSDYTSGLASNPALGRVADRLVELGGAAVLGEIAEIMGAEHLLAARAAAPDAAAQLLRVINRVEAEAMALGLDIRGTQPSPGNIRGGLTTIEEKSLGATHKGGERAPARGRRAVRRAASPDRA